MLTDSTKKNGFGILFCPQKSTCTFEIGCGVEKMLKRIYWFPKIKLVCQGFWLSLILRHIHMPTKWSLKPSKLTMKISYSVYIFSSTIF